jgi:magnesium-transporting ATPase (P-type)
MEVCAVGDGANDELMIREAHCGIGIGIEPTADTRSFSDHQVICASRVQSSADPDFTLSLTDRKLQPFGAIFIRAVPAHTEQ